MDYDKIGFVVSVLVGIGACMWLEARWRKRLLRRYKGQSLMTISLRYKNVVRIANVIFISGIVAAVLVYSSGTLQQNDARGFGICIGGGFIASVLYVFFSGIRLSRNGCEGIYVFIFSLEIPRIIFSIILVLAILGFTASLVSLVI